MKCKQSKENQVFSSFMFSRSFLTNPTYSALIPPAEGTRSLNKGNRFSKTQLSTIMGEEFGMNLFCVGRSLVVNGYIDLFLTAIPFVDMERARVAIEEVRRGLGICRDEYPKECVRFALRSLGFEKRGYPTSNWAGENSILNRI